MKNRMRKVVSGSLSGFKYLLSVYMMLAGLLTAFLTKPDNTTNLGSVYANQFALTGLGLVIFFSGLALLVGKIFRMRRLQGWGLFATYLDFTWAFFLNWYALGWDAAWTNLVGAVIVGALYLRWKYHIYYPGPPKPPRKFFRRRVDTPRAVV